MLTSLTHRQLEGELMDDPDIDVQAHRTALRGLRRINVASRTAAALWPTIRCIARQRRDEPLSLLDVATGGGDVAVALARLAQRDGITLRVEACDISPTALRVAEEQARRADVEVRFFVQDILAEPLPAAYDIIVSTLFLHHLHDEQIVGLLEAWSSQARHLVISDLLRNRTGYGLAYLGTRLLSLSPIVHVDGLKSVRAALTLPEAENLASRAGLTGASFERHWPSRFLLTWSRPASSAAASREDPSCA
ncbi:methyltransferase domain-containing protein [Halomonas sp. McH1-25]|uniref:methyltransferase domain-containing protein n=1 Tax=unclassified Halomonas TaxID=2609666 RepID=UPI001EF67215|nr:MULTISPECIES: methyltransferase domain-containing protein [unclassified Halomonas]MCG7601231.1 methyltransferase domain-containing protein [Halomonas sp. McH1-25]MCP1343689.1 methyltransferase domain-containing protein [Halomonas sp. FL8]MCP1362121.1 methyltransferase domain-containing protein [Halomonas sp. BBD45]MCP1366843.1 methyltransferase domain-containing protein [Halomonas sp. BBD48]